MGYCKEQRKVKQSENSTTPSLLYEKPDKARMLFDKIIKSKFDRFFLNQIKQTKIGLDGLDPNKLR